MVFKLLIHRLAASILPVELFKNTDALKFHSGDLAVVQESECLKFSGYVTSPPLHETPDNSLDFLLHNLFPLLRMGERIDSRLEGSVKF